MDPYEELDLLNQLRAELLEARGQLDQALQYVENRRSWGPNPPKGAGSPGSARERWLAWHKCHEASTNLLNVAEGLK